MGIRYQLKIGFPIEKDHQMLAFHDILSLHRYHFTHQKIGERK